MPATKGARGRSAPLLTCDLCPRLEAFRTANQQAHPGWHNAPAASFGDPAARLLIVGLAPGLRGANRTGRPFTGDHAGVILYTMLARHGLARGTYRADPADGLALAGARITNAVRCVPPDNKPTGGEIRTCRRFLIDELCGSPEPRIVLSLGRIAHDSVLRALGLRIADHPFAHGAWFEPAGLPALAASYHCSRYNLNTGRLTPAMFEQVFERIAHALGHPA